MPFKNSTENKHMHHNTIASEKYANLRAEFNRTMLIVGTKSGSSKKPWPQRNLNFQMHPIRGNLCNASRKSTIEIQKEHLKLLKRLKELRENVKKYGIRDDSNKFQDLMITLQRSQEKVHSHPTGGQHGFVLLFFEPLDLIHIHLMGMVNEGAIIHEICKTTYLIEFESPECAMDKALQINKDENIKRAMAFILNEAEAENITKAKWNLEGGFYMSYFSA
ncbi:hypothetical protein Aperf_G00000105146 [Anoplocephala perfoliata]